MRVDKMFEMGLVSEVENLRKQGYTKDLVSMQGIGYKEIFDYLDKHSSDNEYTPALRAIARELKNTFKKQEWVKRGVLVMLEEGD